MAASLRLIGSLVLLFVAAREMPAIAAEDQHALIGWATVGEGTRGGDGGKEHRAATAEELIQALKSDEPKVVRIEGPIELKEAVRVTSKTTLLGVGPKAKLTGGGLHLRRVHNVIVRNLAIAEASDAINIEESHHIWIDHCDLSNCRDGLLDIKRGSDLITVSWNRFHDHHKTCLLGHSDKDDIRDLDRGRLRVTYHHNYFDGTQTRHPRVRFAEGVHVFNNYFRQNEYGVASVMDAGVIVEANVFEDVKQPTLTAYGDSPDPGRLVARGNLLIRSGPEQTRGTVANGVLQYESQPDRAEDVAALVKSRAGLANQPTQDAP
jgi:pectate lyase